MAESQYKQLNVRIPEEEHKRLKVLAAIEGKPMADIVSELIRDHLQRFGLVHQEPTRD